MIRTILAMLILTLLATGCGDGRQGIVINGDGSVASNTPERAKAHAEELITKDLASRKATVVIAQMPRWQDESRARAEGWYWTMAQVNVTVATAVTDDQRAEITETVRHHLAGAITGGDASLLVTVTTAAEAAEPVPPTPVAAPATARQYTVQQGDTLADISTAFYGTPQHWRAIVSANAGLDPANLVAGSTLVIPAKP